MTEEKKLDIVFAPGCFDSFDGTQEELDAFMKEIQEHISNLTPEQLAEQSVEIDEEYLDKLYEQDPELAVKLVESLINDNQNNHRKLQ